MAARRPSHAAYEAATGRLRKQFQKEFAALLDEEREARGLAPLNSRRRARIADLESQLLRLREMTVEDLSADA